MTMMGWVGECFFWCRLTRVVPDKILSRKTAVCVCVLFLSIGQRADGISWSTFHSCIAVRMTVWQSKWKQLNSLTCRMVNSPPRDIKSHKCHCQISLRPPVNPSNYVNSTCLTNMICKPWRMFVAITRVWQLFHWRADFYIAELAHRQAACGRLNEHIHIRQIISDTFGGAPFSPLFVCAFVSRIA